MAKMSEESPGIANKKLLAVALALAALVVVFYNVQISRVREAGKGDTKKLLRVRRPMQRGEEIGRKDIEVVEVELEYAKGFGNYLTEENLDYAVTSTLNEPVSKGQWLLWRHTTTTERNNPSNRIRPGMVTHTFAIDPRQSPGEILRVGDRVNVLGMLAVNSKPLQTYRIIADLKVVEIGGRSFPDETNSARRSRSEGMRQFQKITVEVSPEVSLQLANVLTHVQGKLWVEVKNPSDTRSRKNQEIHQDLRGLSAAPSVGRRTQYRPDGI